MADTPLMPIVYPLASPVNGWRGPGVSTASSSGSWIWQDGQQHDWQDDTEAEWQDQSPPSEGQQEQAEEGELAWPNQDATEWEDTENIDWEPGGVPALVESDFGFNLGHTTWSESGQYYEDLAKLGTFYRNNTTGGTIDPATGWPLTGATNWNIKVYPGNKLYEQEYTITHSGSGSGPASVTFNSSSDNESLNFNGEIDSPTIIRAAANGTYTPTFAARAKRAKVLRFMNPWRTNNVEYDSANPWVRVVTGANNTFYHRLMTPEDVVQMCEDHGCDAWICIHHLASAANITAILNAFVGFNHHLYVEHSNEVWNSGFPQHNYAKTQLSGGGDHGLAAYTQTGETQNIQAWHADRTDMIGEEAQSILGASNVTTVWASQGAVPNFIVNSIDRAHRALSYIDAAAIAPYVGGPWASNNARTLSEVNGMSDTQIVAEAEDDFENRVKDLVLQYKTEATNRGWRLLLYEFGSHLAAKDGIADEDAMNTRFITASQSNAMGTFYETSYFPWIKSTIDDTVCLYRDVGTDAWGHLQHEQDGASPRWQEWLDETVNNVPTNYALRFDGVDDYIDCGGETEYDMAGVSDKPFSIAAWVKPSDISGFRIVTKGTLDSSERQFAFTGTTPAGKPGLYLYEDGDGATFIARQAPALVADTWTHVVATYDGSATLGGIKIYVNGVQADNESNSGGTYTGMGARTADPVMVARWDTSYGEGTIDDVRMWSREITASEVADVYNGAAGAPAANLMHLEMNEGEGVAVANSEGTDDGTINGSPTWTADVPS